VTTPQPQQGASTAKIVLVWLAVGLVAYLAIAWYQKEKMRPRVMTQAGAQSAVVLESQGRHFVALVKIQGAEQAMLVDTGASMTSIPKRTADKLGLKIVDSTQFQTANGATMGNIAIADLEITGLIKVSNLRIAVMNDMNGEGLLGMDVLRKVRMVQDGGRLILEAAK
jgi:aspartyl protease family protein